MADAHTSCGDIFCHSDDTFCKDRTDFFHPQMVLWSSENEYIYLHIFIKENVQKFLNPILHVLKAVGHLGMETWSLKTDSLVYYIMSTKKSGFPDSIIGKSSCPKASERWLMN